MMHPTSTNLRIRTFLALGRDALRASLEAELSENPFLERREFACDVEPDADIPAPVDAPLIFPSEIPEAPESPAAPSSLYAHLRAQALLEPYDRDTRQAVEIYLAGLDDDGYLVESLAELSWLTGVSVPRLLAAAPLVRDLDPPGCGFTTIPDCLRYQAELRGFGHLVDQVLANHLAQAADTSNAAFDALVIRLQTSHAELREALRLLPRLDPWPGRRLAALPGEPDLPDVRAFAEPQQFRVEYVQDALPDIVLSPIAQVYLARGQQTPAQITFTRAYHTRAQWALWLVRHRRSRLLRLVARVAHLQRAFLLREADYIRALNVDALARHVDVAPADVLPLAHDKRVETPRGIFPVTALITGVFAT